MRVFLKDLQPGTDYSVQLRTDDGKDVSPWSRKFALTTISDSKRPKKPANVTWVAHGSAFVGEWDAVTQKEDGTALKNLDYYQTRVNWPGGTGTGKTYKTTDTRWDFTHDMNMTAFGTPRAIVEFEVRAVDKAGNASDWTTMISAANGAPDPPVLESVTGIEGAIEIKWQRSPSLDVVAYRVFIGDNNSFPVEEGSPNLYWEGDATSYVYPTYTFSLHHIALVAIDAYGTQSSAVWGTATPISPFIVDDTPPEVPTGLTVTPIDSTSVNITWTAGTEDESLAGFYIWFKKAGQIDALAELRTASFDARSLTITGLDPEVDYYFKIRSFDNVANFSAWSPTVNRSGQPNTAPTSSPTPTIRTDQTSLNIEWSTVGQPADVLNGGWFEIDVDEVNTFASPFSYKTGGNSLAVTGLATNTTYYVRLRAVDSEGLTGPWTTTVSATTSVFPTPPGALDGFVPAAVSPAPTVTGGIGYLWVGWNPVTTKSNGTAQNVEDQIRYDVHASTTSGFTPTTGNLITQVNGTFAVIRQIGGSPLSQNVPYYVKIVARDADGAAGSSAEGSGSLSKVQSFDITTGAVKAEYISTGVLSSAVITMGAGGEIVSNNWNATSQTGWRLNETGLTVYNGAVSASALIAGTISGTTINVGAGGTLNVDSTAQIKSNNYSANTSGWRLDSSGLEINTGSVSASALKGGTLSAGIIYVASGGGIYDSTGGSYWSITSTGININNGSIQGASVITNSLRSINTDPNTGQYIFSINGGGYASFAGAQIYGSTVLGSSASSAHFIQSYNYSGSTGWRIDAAGNAYFGYGRITAGLFMSAAGGNRVELGDTGIGDAVDELRMFNSGTVSSVRNPTDDPGTVRMSFGGGGTMTFGRASWDSAFYITMGAQGRIKYTTGNILQSRNYADTDYTDIHGQNIKAINQLESNNGITAQSEFVYFPGLVTSGTANVNIAAGGKLRIASSSKRFKENIIDSDASVDEILALRPVRYQRVDNEDKDGNKLPVTESTPWEFGFIAEEAHDLGLTSWVNYDLEGKPFGFKYDLFTSAHQVVLREHQAKIADLEQRLAELEERL